MSRGVIARHGGGTGLGGGGGGGGGGATQPDSRALHLPEWPSGREQTPRFLAQAASKLERLRGELTAAASCTAKAQKQYDKVRLNDVVAASRSCHYATGA